jgi:hypothetical protein
MKTLRKIEIKKPPPSLLTLSSWSLLLLKNPVISSRIEPMTFRLVAKILNQLHYRVPPVKTG